MLINNFLKHYNRARFHMPGRHGCGDFAPLGRAIRKLGANHKHDITEITGAGDLYSTTGLIAESERQTSRFTDAGAYTIYSAGGSTLCIQTIAVLLKEHGVTRLAAYNDYHIAIKNACTLLGVELLEIEPNAEIPDGVQALWVTSPTYLGTIRNIREIANQCHTRNMYLAVDNAHGAHLFDNHPILLGADLCNDSAHKTLPCLTGGAFLNIKQSFAGKPAAKAAMSLFGSTSPSYLILASLETAAHYLRAKAPADFEKLAATYKKLDALAVSHGFTSQPELGDITKFIVKKFGKTGAEILQHLHRCKIEPELTGSDYVLLMLSPFNKKRDYRRLKHFLKTV